jgi:hypothetical protein
VPELCRGEALRDQHHLRAAAAVLREKAECAQMLVAQRSHCSLALAFPSSSGSRATPI